MKELQIPHKTLVYSDSLFGTKERRNRIEDNNDYIPNLPGIRPHGFINLSDGDEIHIILTFEFYHPDDSILYLFNGVFYACFGDNSCDEIGTGGYKEYRNIVDFFSDNGSFNFRHRFTN